MVELESKRYQAKGKAKVSGEITVVLPVFNEEASIGSMVLLSRKYASRVVVVDDGSFDRTAKLAALAGAEVVRHRLRQGRGAALKTGFEAATAGAAGQGVIVTLNAGGKYDPSDIPRLAAPVLSGAADFVEGIPSGNASPDKPGSECAFRAFSAPSVAIFRFKATGTGIEKEMLSEAKKAGLKVQNVEIKARQSTPFLQEKPVKQGQGFSQGIGGYGV